MASTFGAAAVASTADAKSSSACFPSPARKHEKAFLGHRSTHPTDKWGPSGQIGTERMKNNICQVMTINDSGAVQRFKEKCRKVMKSTIQQPCLQQEFLQQSACWSCSRTCGSGTQSVQHLIEPSRLWQVEHQHMDNKWYACIAIITVDKQSKYLAPYPPRWKIKTSWSSSSEQGHDGPPVEGNSDVESIIPSKKTSVKRAPQKKPSIKLKCAG